MTVNCVVAWATVRRQASSIMSGRWGQAIYHLPGDKAGYYGVSPERLLGRPLATGTQVKVTVEVVDEPQPWPPPRSEQNPWGPPVCVTYDEYEAMLAWEKAGGTGRVAGWRAAGEPGYCRQADPDRVAAMRRRHRLNQQHRRATS